VIRHGATGAMLIVYWLGLTVWITAIGSAGIAAMAVFGTLGDERVPVQLDDYAAYPQAEHGRLLAGQIMDRVFAVVDRTQLVCAAIVVITLLAQLVSRRFPRRPISNVVRTITIAAAAVIVSAHVLAIAPPMNAELGAYRAAAATGDTELAAEHRAAFNQLHPVAEQLLRAELGLLLVAVAASALALRPASRERTS